MKLNPKAKKSTPQRQVSTMHSMRTFTVSRERQKPASSIVKPTCIANTRKAARSVHTVLIGFTMSVALTSPSAANALRPIKSGRKATAAISKATPSPFPIKSNPPYRRHSGSRSRTPKRDIFCEIVSLFFISICECLLKLVLGLCDRLPPKIVDRHHIQELKSVASITVLRCSSPPTRGRALGFIAAELYEHDPF